MKRRLFLEIAVGLIILLFVYASTSKLIAFQKFVGEINNQPLPNSWTPFLSYSIPTAEIVIVILLISTRTRRVGFILSLALMSIFTIYAAIILLHGFSYVPCSCGGVIEHLTWMQHLLLNIFFVLLSSAGLILQRRAVTKR